MTRALGVSCKSKEIMLAVAVNHELVEDKDHERVQAPILLEETERLKGVMDAVVRVIRETRVEDVRVLLPGPNHRGMYTSLAPRATLETLVRLAALNANVPVEVLHRRTARARVGMPLGGEFEKHIPSVIPNPVGRYWSAGRQLAAVAAIAEEKE